LELVREGGGVEGGVEVEVEEVEEAVDSERRDMDGVTVVQCLVDARGAGWFRFWSGSEGEGEGRGGKGARNKGRGKATSDKIEAPIT
jgi:hypothetical protein